MFLSGLPKGGERERVWRGWKEARMNLSSGLAQIRAACITFRTF